MSNRTRRLFARLKGRDCKGCHNSLADNQEEVTPKVVLQNKMEKAKLSNSILRPIFAIRLQSMS